MENIESKPIPDPTVLTVDLTHREISSLKELIDSKLLSIEKQIKAQSELMDNKLRGHIDEAAERFKAIQLQFTERDKRFDLAARDNYTATEKSEVLATKQTEQLSKTLSIAVGNIERQLNDIKDRINRAEGYDKGKSGLWASILSGISAAVAVGTFFILIFHLKGGV